MSSPPSPPPPPWLEALNAAQREAVLADMRPLLVLSGAGTGKTRVLTSRLAWLVDSGQLAPWNILCLTFTNKAAAEMRQRASALCGGDTGGVWLGTFHALGARLLRREAEAAGLTPDFSIINQDDSRRLVRQIMVEMNLDPQEAKKVLATIEGWKNCAETPEQITDSSEAREVYGRYQQRLHSANSVDFGDLVMLPVQLLRTQDEILTRYQRRFRHIMVDEYQDTNLAQYYWLRLLAQEHHGVTCVGDEDQSIYGWRGAEVGNILRFMEDYPDGHIVRLEENYRSTQAIVQAASHLVAHNERRIGKTLRTQNPQGAPIRVAGFYDATRESRTIVEDALTARQQGTSLTEIAILVRTSAQTLAFEEALTLQKVPYRIVGGARFYERQEIRDALAYLRLIRSSADTLAFERIVNTPPRGVGDQTLATLRQEAQGQPVYAYVERLVATNFAGSGVRRGAAQRGLAAFTALIEGWRAEAVSHDVLLEKVVEGSGMAAWWHKRPRLEAESRLENLAMLPAAMREHADLEAFLEHVALVMDAEGGEDVEKLTLMTMHAAKGLEFDIVFLPGWEEGLFPLQRSLEDSAHGAQALEEERRLAYVALTRARQRAVVSFAGHRFLHGRWISNPPSRFIRELPPEVEVHLEAGLRAGPGRHVYQREAPPPPPPSGEELMFEVGESCRHDKFGRGTVIEQNGNIVTVAFDEVGVKKIASSFLRRL